MTDCQAPVSLVLARMAGRRPVLSGATARRADEMVEPRAGSDDDLAAVSKTMTRWARDTAQHRAELNRAREALVGIAQLAETPRPSAGEAIVRVFWELEHEAQ